MYKDSCKPSLSLLFENELHLANIYFTLYHRAHIKDVAVKKYCIKLKVLCGLTYTVLIPDFPKWIESPG